MGGATKARMNLEHALCLSLSVLLAAYLVYALLRPEHF